MAMKLNHQQWLALIEGGREKEGKAMSRPWLKIIFLKPMLSNINSTSRCSPTLGLHHSKLKTLSRSLIMSFPLQKIAQNNDLLIPFFN